MAGELTIFKHGAVQSSVFKGVVLPTQRLDDGIAAGFAKVSYKGGKWGIKYQGQYTPVQARLPDGTLIPSPFLDIVILKTSSHPSKAWYEGVYQEGDSAPPDCWATNGMVPDIGVPKKQSNTCVGCQWNVWGSKVNRDTGMATRGKACMDSKRIACVPVGDVENAMYGGPMMLNIPPTSLKRLGPYQNLLEANGFHYVGVWTRVTFEQNSAYPLMNFDAMAALNDIQGAQVLKMIEHPLVDRILETEMQAAEAWDEAAHATHQTHPTEPVSQGASVTVSGNQATSGNDPGPIPEHLRRPPPTEPDKPVAAAQTQASQPAAEEPKLALPPGMTIEMFDALPEPVKQAMYAAQGQPAATAPKRQGRPRGPRTPPVSPSPADTSQQVASPPADVPAGDPAAPQPQATMVMGTPLPAPGNSNGSGRPVMTTTQNPANDPAVQTIMGTLKKLV